ncbi:hypothetical protein ACIRQP_36955 [Streptomyces sp. NPDC102274]|uniref:hypothetical protein n=1 Tax=Streptomyces sp. NPDC102274 TaxID=3366151 RepID=UPI0037FDA4BD
MTLTGPWLVEYLRKLDYEAHDGPMANADDGPVARRMCTALAPVMDRIKADQAPPDVPRRVVDDAAVSAGSTPSPDLTAKS